MIFKKSPTEQGLEKLIIAFQEEMVEIGPNDEKYHVMQTGLAALYKLKESSVKRVSPDTWVAVVGNLVAVLLVLNYEKAGVITSRAFQFVGKLR